MSIIRTEKDKITKLKAFCGKQNRDYAACLKNAVNILVAHIYIYIYIFAYVIVGHLKVYSFSSKEERAVRCVKVMARNMFSLGWTVTCCSML